MIGNILLISCSACDIIVDGLNLYHNKFIFYSEVFMKKLIASLLVVAMVFLLVACGRAVPDFEDWGTHQIGHITVRIPTDRIEEETMIEQGIEAVIFESTLTGASVTVTQMVDFVQFLRDLGATDEIIMADSLHGSLIGGVTEFLAEAGGEMHGQTEGVLNGVRYYAAYGVTDLNNAYFEARAFAYGDDFYLVMFFWNEANADNVDLFFQSIRFS